MSAPILVTGAGGFAGGHVLDLLARDAAGAVEVVAWLRPGGAVPPPARSVRFEAVDVLDAAAVSGAIARLRPALVYHCAGAAHVGQSWSRIEATFAANVLGTHHLLDALWRAGSEARVVIPSSAMIYKPSDESISEDHPLVPPSPYGLSKLAQELLGCRAIADGLGVTIARPFNHIGPRQSPSFVASSLARQIAEIETGRHGRELLVGNLEARRDMTDVRDTVRAYKTILERGRPGRAYNVCSGRAPSIRDLVDLLVAQARVRISVRVDPKRYQTNDLPVLVGDPSRIRDELGWSAEIPIEQTVGDLLDDWRSRAAGETES